MTALQNIWSQVREAPLGDTTLKTQEEPLKFIPESEDSTMDIREIKELMEQFDKSSLGAIEVVLHDATIKMTKPEVAPVGQVDYVQTSPTPQASVVTPPAPPVKLNLPGYTAVTAPMVGVFYRASSPDADPFVSVGDPVNKGDTLGLIEAMKMMTEIKAPATGVVKEISVENESVLGFGDVIMQIGE